MRKLLSLLVAVLFSMSVVTFAQEAPRTDVGTSSVEKKTEPVKTKKGSHKASKKSKKSKKVAKSKKGKKSKKTKKGKKTLKKKQQSAQ